MMGQAARSKVSKLWSDFVKQTDLLRQDLYLNVLIEENAVIAALFAAKYKTSIPEIAGIQDEQRKVKKDALKVLKWRDWVEKRELGITEKNGDIDIVAPIDTTDDRIQFYRGGGLSAEPITIAVGILIGAAVIAYTVLIRTQLGDLRRRYNKVIKYSETHFCEDKSSPMCADWQSEKEISNFKKNEGLIDKVKRKLGEAATTISGGIGIGLMIAIPLLAYIYLGKKK